MKCYVHWCKSETTGNSRFCAVHEDDNEQQILQSEHRGMAMEIAFESFTKGPAIFGGNNPLHAMANKIRESSVGQALGGARDKLDNWQQGTHDERWERPTWSDAKAQETPASGPGWLERAGQRVSEFGEGDAESHPLKTPALSMPSERSMSAVLAPVGAVAGGLAGSVFGPAGTVAGGLAGAALGGSVGSNVGGEKLIPENVLERQNAKSLPFASESDETPRPFRALAGGFRDHVLGGTPGRSLQAKLGLQGEAPVLDEFGLPTREFRKPKGLVGALSAIKRRALNIPDHRKEEWFQREMDKRRNSMQDTVNQEQDEWGATTGPGGE